MQLECSRAARVFPLSPIRPANAARAALLAGALREEELTAARLVGFAALDEVGNTHVRARRGHARRASAATAAPASATPAASAASSAFASAAASAASSAFASAAASAASSASAAPASVALRRVVFPFFAGLVAAGVRVVRNRVAALALGRLILPGRGVVLRRDRRGPHSRVAPGADAVRPAARGAVAVQPGDGRARHRGSADRQHPERDGKPAHDPNCAVLHAKAPDAGLRRPVSLQLFSLLLLAFSFSLSRAPYAACLPQ